MDVEALQKLIEQKFAPEPLLAVQGLANTHATTEDEELFITRAGQLVHSASESFNFGLRAYYFGLAALTWFVSSGVFMIATAWIVAVLYWREFHSETLNLLKRP